MGSGFSVLPARLVRKYGPSSRDTAGNCCPEREQPPGALASGMRWGRGAVPSTGSPSALLFTPPAWGCAGSVCHRRRPSSGMPAVGATARDAFLGPEPEKAHAVPKPHRGRTRTPAAPLPARQTCPPLLTPSVPPRGHGHPRLGQPSAGDGPRPRRRPHLRAWPAGTAAGDRARGVCVCVCARPEGSGGFASRPRVAAPSRRQGPL